MSAPPRRTPKSSQETTASAPETPAPSVTTSQTEEERFAYKDCLSCRIIGTGALGMTGLYALRMAMPRAPGSVFGKMMMGGIGVGFLAGSVMRWNMTPMEMMGMFIDQLRGPPRQTGS